MSDSVRYHIGGPRADAVARVLNAARFYLREHPPGPSYTNSAREIIEAITALDAPQPRWTADTSNLYCDGKKVTNIFGNELMGVISQMLNDIEKLNAAAAREAQ